MLKHNLTAVRLLALAALAAVNLTAHAALGSRPLSSADAHVSSAARLTPVLAASSTPSAAAAAQAGYLVNTVNLDSGTTVKEFVSSASNQVFALTWFGPQVPDLKELLGASFDTYTAPAAASGARVTRSLSSSSISTQGLVVHTHGVPGHFRGYAYIPALFPAGVTLQSLRSAQ